MTPSGTQDHLYPWPTERSGYRYLFTAKHHGAGSATDARWHLDLNRDDEFAVFNDADRREIADEDGNLYGAIREGEERLRDLGTWKQQIAKFPSAHEGMPWHGYPLWPLNELAPPNRRGQRQQPPNSVFGRMVESGLITRAMSKRLMKGDHL